MRIYQVDAFTNEIFKGNPAAVCLLRYDLTDKAMQNIALEMNLSETAFLKKREDNTYDLRWFTPSTEVNLCGHATLSSAHILWETGVENTLNTLFFHTRSGKLSAKFINGKIELDFPLKTIEEIQTPEFIKQAFGIEPLYTLEGELKYIIEIKSEKQLKELTPDFGLLKRSTNKGFIVTAKSQTDNIDFVSRFFAPNVGINEDPVTGSAHCYLAPYWSKKLNKNPITGLQVSARSGIVECEIRNDRVLLRGYAVTTLEGDLKYVQNQKK